MPFPRYIKSLFFLFLLIPALALGAWAQIETATLGGTIKDAQGGVVPEAEVAATRTETGTVATTKTNGAGIYFFTGLVPGHFRITVRKQGFKEVATKEFNLAVQEKLEQNFSLEVGSVTETVTVKADALMINTTDATVSTVVDRQFAENLPLNGRSFQSLIELTPGVVVAAVNTNDTGQFNVNGQRAASNYWTVDGVSANIGIGGIGSGTNNPAGNGFAGAVGATTVLGGTNSLVSVDAMQEFRIQTSTFAPDTGRTPGGQISIVTRSGTNQFHSSLFDYFRNDKLDANDWFNTAQTPALPKSEERQNDFGGTFGGPIVKDRTFFFFSYESLRLRLPQTTLSQVPDLQARQSATPAMQPFLNAFPFNPNQPDLGNGIAQFNASYSNPSSLDAWSLRIDQKLNDKLTLFGRYNYSPSSLTSRALGGATLNTITYAQDTIQTGTVGITWVLSPAISDDFRFNYSRVNVLTSSKLDGFGGAVPVTPPFPSPFTVQNADFSLDIYSLLNADIVEGAGTHALQRQLAFVDNLAVQKGTHRLAFGVDFRRLSPQVAQAQYFLLPFFPDVPTAETGDLSTGGMFIYSSIPTDLLLPNLSLFAQDTWRATHRLTLTYGLRWDVEFTPSAQSGPGLPSVVNYNNLSQLALAPPGTPPFGTPYGNVAPRIGAAYQLAQKNGVPVTVLRAGLGVYYDSATSEIGNNLNDGYPYNSGNVMTYSGTFPVSPAPPPIVAPNAVNQGVLVGFDPHLLSPYTLEWNMALQQALGNQQTLSASYVGAVGRNLLQTADVLSPNQNLATALLIGNTGISNYNALQVQFQRRLSRGLQALSSYTWSHSIDTGSSGSLASPSNYSEPGFNSQNRGDSNFDLRQAFSAGLTYNIPALKLNRLTRAILGEWSLQSIIQAHTAAPVDVDDSNLSMLLNRSVDIRPDFFPAIPLYLYGPQYPGGKILNDTPNEAGPGCIGPFCPPPTDANGNPLRQGDLGRNAVRGYPLAQWDFSVHREFAIHESLKLQFRAEMFNVLNHPNFGPPLGDISGNSGVFGYPTQTAGQALSGSFAGYSTAGGLNTLYQIGGPRSIQLALKLSF